MGRRSVEVLQDGNGVFQRRYQTRAATRWLRGHVWAEKPVLALMQQFGARGACVVFRIRHNLALRSAYGTASFAPVHVEFKPVRKDFGTLPPLWGFLKR